MRSDKCKKVGFDSFFVIFVAYASLLQWVVKIGARLCQSSAILVHSWGMSFSILAHFTRCWGSLELASLLQWVVKIGARLCQSSAIVVHSWGISFSILAHFTQCWGSLEASRGRMLEVIGAVGSRSGLC